MDSDEDIYLPSAKFMVRSQDVNILEAFWKITHYDINVRNANIEKLINLLVDKQEQCQSEEASTDLQYALERLVKGISSTRQAAREGYTTSLTLVLKKFPILQLSTTLELIEKHQSLNGSKLDKGHTVIGRALAYTAIIRSARVPENASVISSVVKNLLTAASQRIYIERFVLLALEELFRQINNKQFKKYVVPEIHSSLSKGWDDCWPVDLYLFLICQKMFPKTIDLEFTLEHWGSTPIINEETFATVASVIAKTISEYHFLHPVCHAVVDDVISSGFLVIFWKEVVDGNLFMKGQFNRAFLAFDLVKVVLSKDIPVNEKKVVFSNNLVELLYKSIKSTDHPLHLASQELFEFLVKTVKETQDSDIQLFILKSLILPPGTFLIDSETKRDYLAKMVSYLVPKALVEYRTMLGMIVRQGVRSELVKDDDVLISTIQCFAIKQLASLMSSKTVDDVIKIEQLMNFFKWGFFTNGSQVTDENGNVEALSQSVIQASSQNFLKGVETLLQPKQKLGYRLRLSQTCETLMPLLENINEILETKQDNGTLFKISNVIEQWRSMFSTVKKLRKVSKIDSKEQESEIFITLLAHLGFQLFYTNQIRVVEVLEEVQECAKRALKSRKNSLKQKDADDDENEPPWVAVLVDIFLTLLSEGSSFTRNVVGSVFPLLGSYISEPVLQQILDIVIPDKAKDLVDNEDDEVMEEDNEVEFELGSNSESESSEVESSVTTDQDEEFRNKVLEALGPAADVAEQSDEEQYLSDSEMFKLDDAISAAFRGRIKTKKKDDSEQQMRNFRLRCLDLIVKYLHSEPPLRLVLQCIPALIAGLDFATRSKNQTEFLNKIMGTIDLITSLKKFHDVNNVTQDDLKKLFTELIQKLKNVTDLRLSKAVSSFCIFLVVCTKKVCDEDEDDELWYAEVFEKLLKEYFENVANHLHPDIFVSLFQQCPEASSELLEDLYKYAFSEKLRLYQQTKALFLLRFAVNATSQSKADIRTDEKYWTKMWLNLMPKFIAAHEQFSGKKMYLSELVSTAVAVLQMKKKLTLNVDASPEFLNSVTCIKPAHLGKQCKKQIHLLKKLLGITLQQKSGTKKKKKRQRTKSETSDVESKKPKGVEESVSNKLNGDVNPPSDVDNMDNEPETALESKTNTSSTKKKNKKKQKHKKKKPVK